MPDLPLEKVFYRLAQDSNKMPHRNDGYEIQYKNVVQAIRE